MKRLLIASILVLACISLVQSTNTEANWQYLWQYVPNTNVPTGRQYSYHNFNLYITADSTDIRPYPDQLLSFVVYKNSLPEGSKYTFVNTSDSNRKMIASDPESERRHFYPDITGALGENSRPYVLYDLEATCQCWAPVNTKSCSAGNCTAHPGKFQLKISGKMRVFTCPNTASDFYYNYNNLSVENGGSGSELKYFYRSATIQEPSTYDNKTIRGVHLINIFKPTENAHVPVCSQSDTCPA